MNLAELFKKNIVMIPVVISIIVGTFTGIKYIINLTDTINSNKDEIIAIQEVEITNLKRDIKVVQEAMKREGPVCRCEGHAATSAEP